MSQRRIYVALLAPIPGLWVMIQREDERGPVLVYDSRDMPEPWFEVPEDGSLVTISAVAPGIAFRETWYMTPDITMCQNPNDRSFVFGAGRLVFSDVRLGGQDPRPRTRINPCHEARFIAARLNALTGEDAADALRSIAMARASSFASFLSIANIELDAVEES